MAPRTGLGFTDSVAEEIGHWPFLAFWSICVSSGLRKTSWICVWLLARLRISACSGVTNRLTTWTCWGFPSASF